MMKPFLTATAFVALLGFGASAALAQQNTAPLEAPAIEKAAPMKSGKAASEKSGAATNKAVVDSRAKREAARACADIKDKAAHESCVGNHLKNQTAKTPSGKSDTTTPNSTKTVPRTGG